MMEDAFSEIIIDERSRRYCLSLLENVKVLCEVREITDGRAKLLLILGDPVLTKKMEWIHERLPL